MAGCPFSARHRGAGTAKTILFIPQILSSCPIGHRDRLRISTCQGTAGAYSEQAARRLFAEPDIRFVAAFDDVFRAVERGETPYGVLPIENSTAGSVAAVYDLMRSLSGR